MIISFLNRLSEKAVISPLAVIVPLTLRVDVVLSNVIFCWAIAAVVEDPSAVKTRLAAGLVIALNPTP